MTGLKKFHLTHNYTGVTREYASWVSRQLLDAKKIDYISPLQVPDLIITDNKARDVKHYPESTMYDFRNKHERDQFEKDFGLWDSGQ